MPRRAGTLQNRLAGAASGWPRRGGWLYAGTAAALAAVWFGRFLISTRIGGIYSDWHKESYYLEYLRYGLRHGTVPVSFIAHPVDIANWPAPSQSVSYWGNPEVLTLSPWLVLLALLPVAVYIKVNFAVHVAIGAAGAFILGRRLRVGLLATLALLVFLVLNPWLLEHIAIGYSPWVSVCYLPFVAALAVGGPPLRAREAIAASVADALVLYEGGLHIFLWANGALVAVAVLAALVRRSPQPALRPMLILAGSGVLAFPKLVATYQAFGGWHRDITNSYGSVADVWGLLTDAHTNLYDVVHTNDLYGTAFYDGSFFVGKALVVLVVLALGVAIVRVAKASATGRTDALATLVLPAAAGLWLALGWRGVWKFLAAHLRLLSVEVYPFRFFHVAVALLLVFLVLELDRFARRGPAAGGLVAVALVVTTIPLALRNETFVSTALQTTYASRQGPLPQTFLAASITAHPVGGPINLPISYTTNRVVVDPRGATHIELPWLPTKFDHEFDLQNAVHDPTIGTPTHVHVLNPTAPVVLRARSYGRDWLILASFLLFVAYGAAIFVAGGGSLALAKPSRRAEATSS